MLGVQKYLGSNQVFGQQNLVFKNVCRSKNVVGEQILGVNKMLGGHKFLVVKNLFRSTNFGGQKMLGVQKFWVKFCGG